MPEDFWGEQAVKLIDQVDQIGSARLIEPVIYLDSVFHLNWKNARERSIKRSSILKQSVIYSRPLDFLSKYKGMARDVLEALLDKYMNTGIYEIEKTEILKLDPFQKFGKPAKIAQFFGGKAGYLQAIKELEEELYKVG